ncbi:MAG: hypothetical protein EOM90_13870 [Alphaproteobacteria bacterium]|nr:hypothetical protein [Alphaproteobacteria bacterium]
MMRYWSMIYPICLFFMWSFPHALFSHSISNQDSLFLLHQTLGSSECFGVAFGDVDNNGTLDGIVVNFQGQSRLWKNEGNGNFTSTGQTFGNGTNHGGELADVDGDGDLDLFLVSTMATDKVYFNDGIGNFTNSGQNLGGAMDFSVQLILEDMDGDGDPDALVARNLHTNFLWINNGSGFFTELREIGDTTTYFMSVADVDGDGDPDVYLEYQYQPDRILLNDGTGYFTDTGQAIGFAEGDGHGLFYDLDDDSDPDLILTNSIFGNSIWLNDGTGIFSPSGSVFGSGYGLTVLDADMDTDPDVITFHPERPCYLWVNDGSMNFDSAGVIFPGDQCWSITPEDVDLDGDIDVVAGNSAFNSGTTKLYMNQSSPSTGEVILPVNTIDNLHVYPNPVIRDVTIFFTLKEESRVKLILYDVSMRMVGLLAGGLYGQGEHRVMKTLDGFSHGLYYVVMLSNDSERMHRILFNHAN